MWRRTDVADVGAWVSRPVEGSRRLFNRGNASWAAVTLCAVGVRLSCTQAALMAQNTYWSLENQARMDQEQWAASEHALLQEIQASADVGVSRLVVSPILFLPCGRSITDHTVAGVARLETASIETASIVRGMGEHT